MSKQRVFNYLERMAKHISDNQMYLFVGWDNEYMSMLARIHEFGTIKIPSRPHRRNTLAKYGVTWRKYLVKQLKENDYDIELALNRLGDMARRNYGSIIRQGEFHPLAPKTLYHRKLKDIRGTLPLNATGEMARQLMFKVVKDE